jgi:GntR family transcriptional repressor for pyruvate dehydrogenase complex
VDAAKSRDFRAVRKSRISEEIIEQVRDLITSGRLKPGDRLPAERELAQILKVGRSTVREAIRAMESLGLLRVRAGEGTFLVAATTDSEVGSVPEALLRSWDGQHKLFEVRRVIEPDLAAFAARRATPEQIVTMQAVLGDQEEEIRQGGNGMKADTAFHYLLATAAGNEVLVRIMDSLMDRLQETRAHSLRAEGRPVQSLRQHRAILAAIESRDAKAAEKRMLAHLRGMENLAFHAQPWQEVRGDGDPHPGEGATA